MAILKPRDRRTACTLKSEVDRILQTWQALSNEDDKRAFISESQAKIAEIQMVSLYPLPFHEIIITIYLHNYYS